MVPKAAFLQSKYSTLFFFLLLSEGGVGGDDAFGISPVLCIGCWYFINLQNISEVPPDRVTDPELNPVL